MSRIERRALVRCGRRSGDPYTAVRFHVIARLARGERSPEVAEALDIARSTVVRTATVFAKLGVEGLFDQRRRNGAPKVEDRFRARVAALLRDIPQAFGWFRPTWTRELRCLQMAREGWPRVAVCTMGRALAYLGARLGVPKPIVLCPWPVMRARLFCAEFVRLSRARARTSRSCTPTRLTSISTPRSGATGCCAVTSVAS